MGRRKVDAKAAKVGKLTRRSGLPIDLIENLVDAGYDNPAKLRQASDAEIEAVPGIGKSMRATIRKRFPRKG